MPFFDFNTGEEVEGTDPSFETERPDYDYEVDKDELYDNIKLYEEEEEDD